MFVLIFQHHLDLDIKTHHHILLYVCYEKNSSSPYYSDIFIPKTHHVRPKKGSSTAPEEGVIRDVSGTNFSGVAAEDFTVRTALTGSSPLGWRLVASNISAAGA